MKRLLVLVAALALIGALMPAESSARTLNQRVRSLENKVRALQAEANCLQRTGAATFFGYAWYEGDLLPELGPYPVHDPADDFTDTDIAVNFTHLTGGSPDYWLVAVKNTRSCRSKYRGIANPYARTLAPHTQRAMALRQLSRIQ